jgi:cyclin G-associated kinase
MKATPPVTEFDFLNLGASEKPPVPEPPKIAKKEPSFDLLGGFDSNFSDPFPDLVGSALNKPTEPIQTANSGNRLDDFFGSLPQTSATPIVPSKSSSDLNGLNLNFGAKQQQPEASKDPFADLTKSLHPEWSSAPPKTTPSPMGTQYSTPIHQFGSSSASATPKNNPSTPIHQVKSPSEPQRPDYSRSHFADNQQQQAQGAVPKTKSGDIFGDILGSQGYSFGSKTSQGPKSINEMRKVEMAQTMDPERLKVMEWVSLYYNFRTIKIKFLI